LTKANLSNILFIKLLWLVFLQVRQTHHSGAASASTTSSSAEAREAPMLKRHQVEVSSDPVPGACLQVSSPGRRHTRRRSLLRSRSITPEGPGKHPCVCSCLAPPSSSGPHFAVGLPTCSPSRLLPQEKLIVAQADDCAVTCRSVGPGGCSTTTAALAEGSPAPASTAGTPITIRATPHATGAGIHRRPQPEMRFARAPQPCKYFAAVPGGIPCKVRHLLNKTAALAAAAPCICNNSSRA